MLFANGELEMVRKIVLDLDDKAESEILDTNFVRKSFKKMGIDIDATGYVPKRLSDVNYDDEDEFCQMYSTWLMVKKGVLLGRIVGERVPADLIPNCYVDALKKAQEVATNA
jgi:putative ATP-dependent endonuclease of OLD family